MTSALSELGRRTESPAISWLMAQTLAHPHLISLAAGFTDNQTLPRSEAHRALTAILRKPARGQAALQYGSTPGDPVLRTLTAARVRDLDSAPKSSSPHHSDGLVMTAGSQQLLYLVAEALCDPGDVVLVEDPTYFVFLGITQSRGVKCRGVRMTHDGIDPAHLEEVLESLKRSGELKRVKLLYLVSYHQNPSGRTTSWEKKVQALELLRRYERLAGHPIYLLEDAAYRELRFTGVDVPSALMAAGGADRVIYTGTYSKPFATGVRVGFGFLPEPLRTTVLRIKGNHDFGSSSLLQHLLAEVLKTGAYEHHLAALRKRYLRKARILGAAMREHFPDAVQWEEPHGGLYLWTRLPQKWKSGARSKFFKAALANDVLYVPGELCYAIDPARPRPNHEMRISFGGASIPHLREGAARLGAALHKLK